MRIAISQSGFQSGDRLARHGSRIALILAVVCWCLVIGTTWIALAVYHHRPGALDLPPGYWPSSSRLPRAVGQGSLVVFAHPRCPCTQATLVELQQLLAPFKSTIRTMVVFADPRSVGDDWASTALVQDARRIPGVTVVIDQGQVETHKFAARTSGVALFYDRHGQLRFHGGLTPSRGHQGDSVGLAMLHRCLSGQINSIDRTMVFGCPLQDEIPIGAPTSEAACLPN